MLSPRARPTYVTDPPAHPVTRTATATTMTIEAPPGIGVRTYNLRGLPEQLAQASDLPPEVLVAGEDDVNAFCRSLACDVVILFVHPPFPLRARVFAIA